VVHLGSSLAGAEGALAGHMVGGILFGCLSVWLCRHLIEKLLSEPFRQI